MGTIRLAANYIVATDTVLARSNRDSGHLQIVYDDGMAGTPLVEAEVQAPLLVFAGDWDFEPFGQDHGANTDYISTTDVILDPSRYSSTNLSFGSRDADDVWDLMRSLHGALSDAGSGLDYDVGQNSNSYVNTMLWMVGLNLSSVISGATPSDVTQFPGASKNVLLGSNQGFSETAPVNMNLTGEDSGTGAADFIRLGIGNDTVEGSGGNDTLDGGDGDDISVYRGSRYDYSILFNTDGTVTVQDTNDDRDGVDTLTNFEFAQFSDSTVSLKPGKDIAFVVDTTGSMADDIASVKSQVNSIINQIFSEERDLLNSRIAVVGFNDPTTETVLSFTNQPDPEDRKTAALNAINSLRASGGGDFPEMTYSGLLRALDGRAGEWRPEAAARKVILFGDATAKDTDLKSQVYALARDLGVGIDDRTDIDPEPAAFRTLSLAEGLEMTTFETVEVDEDTGTEVVVPVQIFTVVIGGNSSTAAEYEEIASETGGSTFTAADATEIVDALLEVINLPIYTISAASSSVLEGDAGTSTVDFVISRDVSGEEAIVGLALAGSADDVDRLGIPDSVTFLADETSKTVTVTINGDTDIEENETLTVSLASVSSPATIGVSSATVTIENDDSDIVVNSAPTDIQLSTASIDENSDINTVIGSVLVTDVDVDDTHGLALLNDAGGLFQLDGTNLIVAGTLDFEDSAEREITIRATDEASASFEKTLTVSINDLAESFIGGDANDVIIGDAGINDIQGLAGDDQITSGRGADQVQLGAGSDTLEGALSDFDGDTVSDFGAEDTIVFRGQSVTREELTITTGSAIIAVDADSDGTAEATFTLEGDFTDGGFMASRMGTDTFVTFENHMIELSEGVSIEAALINGIMNTNYLSGTNMSGMSVTFEASARAKFNNTVGLYEVDGSGNLVSVQILAENAKEGGTVNITGIDPNNSVGLFLVQDGDRKISDAAFDRDNFSFIDDGSGGFDLADNGEVINGINVFFSHDAALNPDGQVHVVSGVSNDNEGAMRIGFEDLLRNGRSDDDFQDVLLYVDVA